MPWLVVWSFLKNHLGAIIVGIFIFACLAYVETLRLEVDHYKSKAAVYEQTIADLKSKNKVLEDEGKLITKKYANTGQELNDKADEVHRLTAEGIKRDQKLATVELSLNAVRLFNATKSTTSDQTTSTTIKNNAGSTNPTPTFAVTKTFTLADLLNKSAENDINHLKCVKQVQDWQAFWTDYTVAVKKAEIVPIH